jgi:hypothetical protein
MPLTATVPDFDGVLAAAGTSLPVAQPTVRRRGRAVRAILGVFMAARSVGDQSVLEESAMRERTLATAPSVPTWTKGWKP